RLGECVVRALLDAGSDYAPHEVTVFDLLAGPEQQRRRAAPGRDEGPVRYLVGDVQDLGQVASAVAGADAIIHLAAIHRAGLATDEVTFRANVMGTFNVHEAARLVSIRRVVSTSSTAVLGWDFRARDFAPEYLPVDENHPVRPQDPYGLSKEAGEAIARSYALRCGLETVVLRPPWIASPEEMDELRLTGGVKPSRFSLYSYIDARDLAMAYRSAIEQPVSGSVVLFTPADDSSVAEPLSDLLPRLLPSIGQMARELTGSRPALSNARAKKLLSWRPLRSWRAAAEPA
ncbi:MAG: NAD(P)-dependent oxidoreductase, partial [candidate division NC10 bacterium]